MSFWLLSYFTTESRLHFFDQQGDRLIQMLAVELRSLLNNDTPSPFASTIQVRLVCAGLSASKPWSKAIVGQRKRPTYVQLRCRFSSVIVHVDLTPLLRVRRPVVLGPTSPGGCHSTCWICLAHVGPRSARARCC